MERTKIKATEAGVGRRRRWLQLVVGVPIALAFLTATPNAASPWVAVRLNPDIADPEPFRWLSAVEGGIDTLLVVAMVAVLARPLATVAAAQWLALSTLIAALVVTPAAGPSFLITVALLVAFLAVHPSPRLLLSLHRPPMNPWTPMVALALLTAAVLVPLSALLLHRQAIGADGQLATYNGWVTAAEHLLLLAACGLIAATGRPGWRLLALGTAAALGYLSIASVLLPDHPGSWGLLGLAALLPAAGWLVLAVRRPLRLPAL